MLRGNFYFLKEKYFEDFADPYLERNKEYENGVLSGRPFFYSIYNSSTKIHWMIPISSKVSKYRKIEEKIISKIGRCDTIVFGNVQGNERAFLIQNMCPTIDEYIDSEYTNSFSGTPNRVRKDFEREIVSKSNSVLARVRKGRRNLIFPDVLSIEKILIEKIIKKTLS